MTQQERERIERIGSLYGQILTLRIQLALRDGRGKRSALLREEISRLESKINQARGGA